MPTSRQISGTSRQVAVRIGTSAEEVTFSSALVSLFVCRHHYAKNTQPIFFTEFGEKMAHGPRKKSLDFNGNPDNGTLGYRLRLGGAPHGRM